MACRTNLDRRDVDRVVDDAVVDVRSNHPHSRSARRHSPSVRRPSAILVGRRRVTHAATADRRGAAAPAPDRCALRMRSARERPA